MGAAIAVVIELFGIGSLPVAIGLYLPIGLSTPIMVGGIIRGIIDKKAKKDESCKDKIETGVLYSSGLIAGEGLMGVIIAIFTYFKFADKLALVEEGTLLGKLPALLIFLLMTLRLIYIVFKKSKAKKAV
jgi:hypothetical protein